MWFIYLISWLAFFVHLVFLLISLASGLYYLAELVEEYSEISKKVITWMTLGVLLVYICFIFVESMYPSIIICGIVSQLVHLLILQNFPMVSISSLPFIGGIILFFINHYLTFGYFSTNFYSFSEVIGFFTICVWLVPFALFISLSANDYVLPKFAEPTGNLLGGGNDALGNYLSKKQKKYGLLPFLHYVQELFLPRSKKMF